MKTLNRTSYTREGKVSLVTFQLSKEKIEKDNERDQIMENIMTQLDILSKNFMGVHTKCINIVRVGSTHPYDMKFEVLYTENMNFLAKQCGGYRSNYSR